MSYAPKVVDLADFLIDRTAQNPTIHEREFYILWNGLLGFHFPMAHAYLVGPKRPTPRAGFFPAFTVFRVADLKANIVLVLDVKKPADNTPAGKQRVVEELVAYTQQHLDETDFSTVYAIGAFGLSFGVYKMEKSRPLEPELVFDWSSNVTAPESFTTMVQLASMIDEMTGTVRRVE
ncbi:hypothetical protein EDC04DRAFT_101289 [Pisolithus marmoratus]|nr:hypothetical protein EDC04DRAFT_101289 [Pisolithus marmoratus]